MKLKSVLLFSTVIASLTFMAIADEKDYEISFKGEGQFGQYFDDEGKLVFFPYPGPDLLNVSHLGKSEVDWIIRVNLLSFDPLIVEFVDGWFTITGANGIDSLKGYYSGFVLNGDTGDYDLEWAFTGGTGRFEGATGIGHTDGLANLLAVPPHAKFEFSGMITVQIDEDDQGDDD